MSLCYFFYSYLWLWRVGGTLTYDDLHSIIRPSESRGLLTVIFLPIPKVLEGTSNDGIERIDERHHTTF